MAARKPELLRTAAKWIDRLDNSAVASTGVKVYRVRYGDCRQIAKLLSDLFIGGSASNLESPANQIAPGSGAANASGGYGGTGAGGGVSGGLSGNSGGGLGGGAGGGLGGGAGGGGLGSAVWERAEAQAVAWAPVNPRDKGRLAVYPLARDRGLARGQAIRQEQAALAAAEAADGRPDPGGRPEQFGRGLCQRGGLPCYRAGAQSTRSPDRTGRRRRDHRRSRP